MNQPDTRAYVAICPQCKRCVGAIVQNCRDVAKEVAKLIRAGFSIDRAEDVAKLDWCHTDDCPLNMRARKKKTKKERAITYLAHHGVTR